MMRIEYSSTFKKSLRKLVAKRPDVALIVMQKVILFSKDPNHPSLELHKLKGELQQYHSFTVEYDLRIILEFEGADVANFITIGTHDEVY